MESCYVAQGTQPGALRPPRGVGWGGGCSEAHEGEDVCIFMAHSHCCTAENTTAL